MPGIKYLLLFFCLSFLIASCDKKENARIRLDFTGGWKFYPGDGEKFNEPSFDDSHWRSLDLPHDWSIEGEFSNDHPTKINGGALPAGIGWYRKDFSIDQSWQKKQVFSGV